MLQSTSFLQRFLIIYSKETKQRKMKRETGKLIVIKLRQAGIHRD